MLLVALFEGYVLLEQLIECLKDLSEGRNESMHIKDFPI